VVSCYLEITSPEFVVANDPRDQDVRKRESDGRLSHRMFSLQVLALP
jgi:hypothetical protein